MALGGGTFTTQNKILPGSYINVVSTANANAALSDRGTAAMGVQLSYAPGGVFEVTNESLYKNSLELFACGADDAGLRPIREALKNARKVYVYNLCDSGAVKASNTYATAKYAGTGGNSIKISITQDIDNSSNYVVSTLVGSVVVDEQSVAKTGKTTALAANDHVDWKADVALTETASLAMTGGAGSMSSGVVSVQNALNAFEAYSFNTLCMDTGDSAAQGLIASYTKRLRDEAGKKFQSVVYSYDADHEGVVNVVSTPSDVNKLHYMVFWAAGALAGCALNASLTNRLYNGELSPKTDETQSQLEAYIEGGKFAFHKVGDDVRVLMDINSLKTTTEEKGEIFKKNQTVRVADQIANDIAAIFNTSYIGAVQNSNTGRALFKADIVEHHNQLNAMNAIENFTSGDVTVEAGTEKTAVVVTDAVTIVGAMEKLYMTVYVS